ncbi:multiple epidermal growth factor-like domains protein 6 [Elysia marginata]|uniref:Multiple epidermal growth factor-like domains protein 6 n=1 Tax=Elysia marginata TaxID=1093978 RepID=A0AAV4JE21_9GAST|nr:multiple epidermal growth factor-like domains protein 6 [Elysia marginata]
MGQCRCDSGFFATATQCRELLDVGSVCTATGQCRDLSECSTDSGGTCVCIDNHYQDLTQCLPRLREGQPCNHSIQCVDKALCPHGPGFEPLLSGKTSAGYSDGADIDQIPTESLCSCVSGFYPSGGQCVAEIDTGFVCNSSIQCTAGALCEETGLSKVCVCQPDFYETDGKCQPLVPADLPCKVTAMCTVNATCVPDIPKSLCRTGQCTVHSQCLAGREPGQNICVCDLSHYMDGGKCLEDIPAGLRCDSTHKCTTHAACEFNGFVRECQCSAHFYARGGACLPRRNARQSCDAPGQCIMGAECQLIGSSHYQEGQTCVERSRPGEVCSNLGQCVPNAECDLPLSPSAVGLCRCLPGFYKDSGVCKTAIDAGRECELQNSCVLNAQCTPVQGGQECICDPDFYQEGPLCETRINASLPCTSIDQCIANAKCLRAEPDSSAIGDSHKFTCQCTNRFFQSNNLQCLPLKNVLLPCSDSRECTPGAACEFRGQIMSEVCMCMSGFYRDGDVCSLLKKAGQSCYGEDQCIQDASCSGINPNTTELSSSTLSLQPGANASCVCNRGFFQGGQDCLPLIPVDQACVKDYQCTPGAYCGVQHEASVCTCNSEHFQNGSKCALLRNASTPCLTSRQCISGAECVDSQLLNSSSTSKVCECVEGYYEDGGNICRTLINASRPCKFDFECTGGADCIEIIAGVTNCVCREGAYFEDELHQCRSLLNASSPCEGIGQCIHGAECRENGSDNTWKSCVCQDSFYEDKLTHTCEDVKLPGMECEESRQCIGSAYCKVYNEEILGSGICTCKEDMFYQHGLECKKRINATSPCFGLGQCIIGASCKETSNVSNSSRYECVCDDNFYLNRQSCYALKNVSEPCTAKGQCVEGAECLGEVGSSTCACVEGYYQDLTECKPRKNPGISCALDLQCIRQAECVGESKLQMSSLSHRTSALQTAYCRCRVGFYQNASDCMPLLNATQPCTALGQCIDGAECAESVNIESVTEMKCTCLRTHYMENQLCFPLINATLGCESSTQCVSGATCEEKSTELSGLDTPRSTCTCKDGYFNKEGLCHPVVNATESCQVGDECVYGAVCKFSGESPNTDDLLENGVCTCSSGFYLEDKRCTPLKNASEDCLFDYQCLQGAMCLRPVFEQTCTCVGGYFQYDKTCKIFVNVSEPCDEKDKCVPNSICTNNAFGEPFCTCLPDFYAKDKRCFPRIAVDLSCERNRTCTVGAFCSPATDTCQCGNDFFPQDTVCLPLVEASKPCDMTEHCVANAVCDKVTRTCRCKLGFFETNGKCKESIDAGDVCPQSGTCTEFAECDTKNTSTCVCNTGFYNHEGDCKELIPAGLPCSRPGQCVTSATCNSTDFTCHCNDGFYIENRKCYPLHFVDETCEEDRHCTEHSACSVGDGSVCKCRPDFYTDKDRRCTHLINVSQKCNTSSQCVRNASCNPWSSLCSCEDGFYEKHGLCFEKIEAEGSCEPSLKSDQCVDNGTCLFNISVSIGTGSALSKGMCKCDTGFYSDFGQCWLSKTHSSPCNESRQCVENAQCSKQQNISPTVKLSSGQCRCIPGFYSDARGYCLELIPAGEVCPETSQCTSNASCSRVTRRCECDTGFYENTKGKCETLIEAGKPCLYDSQCTFNATCPLSTDTSKDNQKCTCETQFYSQNGHCELLKDPGQSCNETRQCVPRSFCSQTSQMCECTSGFYETSQNLCEPLKLVDELCYEDRECIVNASCVNGSCFCDQGFYTELSPRTCTPVKPPNTRCKFSSQCTTHADCLFDIMGNGKCVCRSEYYADSSSATCEKLIPSSRPCLTTVQCTRNSQCLEVASDGISGILDSTTICVCKPDYYETKDGACKDRILIREMCNSTEQCVDFAACSDTPQGHENSGSHGDTNRTPQNFGSKSQVCSCVDGFFGIHGHCLPLLTAGRQCNNTEQCVDNADCSLVYLDIKACTCRKNFYVGESGLCQPKVHTGLPCAESVQCVEKAFCNITGMVGVCECITGYYNNQGLCMERIKAGKVCVPDLTEGSGLDGRDERQCTDFAACVADSDAFSAGGTNTGGRGRCLCEATHYNHEGVCKELIGAGEVRCHSSDMCTLNAECQEPTGICRCLPEFYSNTRLCERRLKVQETCKTTNQCTKNAECSVIKECRCLPKFYDDAGKCFPIIKAGRVCETTHQCTPNSVCTDSSGDSSLAPNNTTECECFPGYYTTASDECELRSKVDEGCLRDGQCVQHAGCIYPGVCKCDRGYYTTSDNQCEPRMPPSQNCMSTHQCTEQSTCVGNLTNPTALKTCKCLADYFPTVDKCLKRIDVGEPCNTTDQCTTHASCDYTVTHDRDAQGKVCQCPDEFYSEQGKCWPRKKPEKECDKTYQCTHNASCIYDVCYCRQSFYHDKAGLCSPRITPGQQCTEAHQCVQNAQCLWHAQYRHSVCLCAENFYNSSSGECFPRVPVDKPCTQSFQCTSNAVCSFSANQTNASTRVEKGLGIPKETEIFRGSDLQLPGFCECEDDFYSLSGRCLARALVKEPCTFSGMCTDQAMCERFSDTCECLLGYFSRMGKCLPQKLSGHRCQSSQECTQNSRCEDVNIAGIETGICVCLADFYNSSGLCFDRIEPGFACANTSQCTENAFCDAASGMCLCENSFFSESGICMMKTPAEDECTETYQCTPNSVCSTSRDVCECLQDFYNSSRLCLQRSNVGMACDSAYECTRNSKCENGTCMCKPDYYVNGHKCRLRHLVRERCNQTHQCTLNAFCDSETKTCRCEQNFYSDIPGVCVARRKTNERCALTHQCVQNAECDQHVSQCLCRAEFYNVSSNHCEGKLLAGAECNETYQCTQDSTCLVSNGVKKSCKCKDSHYEDMGLCRPRIHVDLQSNEKAYDVLCSATHQCVDNAFCDTATRKCQCLPGFYNTTSSLVPAILLGTCVRQLFVGDSCQASFQCAVNSSCDHWMRQCKCVEGFYSNAARLCQQKVKVGEVCNETLECINNAVCRPGTCLGHTSCSRSPAAMICQCENGFYNVGTSCKAVVGVGDICDIDTDKCAINSECVSVSATNASIKPHLDSKVWTRMRPMSVVSTAMTCQCTEDFFAVRNGSVLICEAKKLAGESCWGVGMCVHGAECSSDQGWTCRCISDFYMAADSRLCRRRIPVGQNCSKLDQCVQNADCVEVTVAAGSNSNTSSRAMLAETSAALFSPTSDASSGVIAPVLKSSRSGGIITDLNGRICQCLGEDFYQDEEGICQRRHSPGKSCIKDDECVQKAQCDRTTKRCICQSDFYAASLEVSAISGGAETGRCLKRRKPGMACWSSDQCVAFATCNSTTRLCQCDTGYYNSAGLMCTIQKPPGDSCHMSLECTRHATCQPSGLDESVDVCTCGENYYAELGVCRRRLDPGEKCDKLYQCVRHAHCDPETGMCKCSAQFFNMTGEDGTQIICKALIEPFKSCKRDGTCVENAACVDSVCRCTAGYYARDGQCLPVLLPGSPCDQFDVCQNFSTCDRSTVLGRMVCSCRPGYFANEATCQPALRAGLPCWGRGQCVSGAECRANQGWLCVCGTGFYQDVYGFCYPLKPVWSPCNASHECTSHAQCRAETGANKGENLVSVRHSKRVSHWEVLCRCDVKYSASNGQCLAIAETEDTVTSSSSAPWFVVVAAIVAGLILCLLVFLVCVILYRRRNQKRQPVEDTVSTVSDSGGSVSSSLKPPGPPMAYAVPFYMPPPPSITNSLSEAGQHWTPANSDLVLQYLNGTPRQSLSNDLDVISASMKLDDEEL